MKVATSARKARSVAQAALSQGFSAASNFVIVLGLGRGGGERVVAEFFLAFVVYNAALGLQRALITDALLARPFHDESLETEDARAATTSLLLSGAAALVALVVGMATPYHQLIWLAPVLPILLLEDLCRYLLFRRQRPTAAAVIDGVWALCSCVGFFYLIHHASSRAAIVVWGIGGTAGALAGIIVARIRIGGLRTSLGWWRRELWGSSRWLTLESMTFHADQNLTSFGITAMAGKDLYGDWQLTGSLLGVAAFLNVGLVVMSVTHFSRGAGDRRSAALVSLTSFSFAALLTLLLVVAAPTVIPILYADKVHLPASTIIPTGVFLALGSASAGPISLIRARRQERVLPLARLVALLAFSPAAVVMARHHFTAALWLLAAGSLTYLAVVTIGALRLDPLPSTDEPDTPEEVARELAL